MPGRRTRRARATAVFDGELPIYEAIAVDVNTQCDFLTAEGNLPIANRQGVLERVKKLIDWVKRYRLPVLSLVDVHRPNGENIRFPLFHCIEGTLGQRKLPFTLLPKRYLIDHDCSPAMPEDLLENYRQVVIRKRTNETFTRPKADRLFSTLHAKRLMIVGVGAERAVESLVLGLLSRGKCPIVVTDACGYWDRQAADLAVRQVQAKGANLIETAQLIQTPPEQLPVLAIAIKADED